MKRHAALVPLSRQHHDGLALGVMIQRGLLDGAGPATSAECERLRKQALDLWQLEFRGHFEVEEQIVFPAAREAVDPGLVDALLAEHEEIRQQFAALEQASEGDAGPLLGRLRDTLVRHIRTEERELFEAMQEGHGRAAAGRSWPECLPMRCPLSACRWAVPRTVGRLPPSVCRSTLRCSLSR